MTTDSNLQLSSGHRQLCRVSLKDFVDAKDMQSYLANLKKARNYTGYTMTRSVKEFD
jgi:hypothetical protein